MIANGSLTNQKLIHSLSPYLSVSMSVYMLVG